VPKEIRDMIVGDKVWGDDGAIREAQATLPVTAGHMNLVKQSKAVSYLGRLVRIVLGESHRKSVHTATPITLNKERERTDSNGQAAQANGSTAAKETIGLRSPAAHLILCQPNCLPPLALSACEWCV